VSAGQKVELPRSRSVAGPEAGEIAANLLPEGHGPTAKGFDGGALAESLDTALKTSGPVRLNLGAGATEIEGYEPIDRKNGQEVYPLECDDNSVDIIYASHVLEHFSHTETHKVLAHWMEKLKPGGLLRLAVPDFPWICEHYMDGEAINTMGYVMGGHVDENDRHGALFDREMLIDAMVNAGLERIGSWESEYQDCSALPVSLNLQGYKPATSEKRPTATLAILSAPRFGPVLHMRCGIAGFGPLGIPYEIGQGAYWHQVLSGQIEAALENEAIKFIITCDYDTAFSPDDVMELWRLSNAMEDADAICPLQCKRGTEHVLCGLQDEHGVRQNRIAIAELARPDNPARPYNPRKKPRSGRLQICLLQGRHRSSGE